MQQVGDAVAAQCGCIAKWERLLTDTAGFAADIQGFAARIRQNVQRVIVGKDDAINLAIIAALCRGHALVEDAPGIGKTTLAKALAQSLGCNFKRIQFTPDLMPTDVLGVNFYNQRAGDFEFREGCVLVPIVYTHLIYPFETQGLLLCTCTTRI